MVPCNLKCLCLQNTEVYINTYVHTLLTSALKHFYTTHSDYWHCIVVTVNSHLQQNIYGHKIYLQEDKYIWNFQNIYLECMQSILVSPANSIIAQLLSVQNTWLSLQNIKIFIYSFIICIRVTLFSERTEAVWQLVHDYHRWLTSGSCKS